MYKLHVGLAEGICRQVSGYLQKLLPQGSEWKMVPFLLGMSSRQDTREILAMHLFQRNGMTLLWQLSSLIDLASESLNHWIWLICHFGQVVLRFNPPQQWSTDLPKWIKKFRSQVAAACVQVYLKLTRVLCTIGGMSLQLSNTKQGLLRKELNKIVVYSFFCSRTALTPGSARVVYMLCTSVIVVSSLESSGVETMGLEAPPNSLRRCLLFW